MAMFGHGFSPFTLLMFYNICYARPTDNTTTQNLADARFVGYIEDPAGRGTSSLVLSCFLTLVLCVWSALHLNVPPPNQSRSGAFWSSVIWIMVGIYAPELVVFAAWRQWSSARILSQQVKAQQKEEQQGKVSLTHPWTMTHSFFASTGGFAFECPQYIYSAQNPNGFLPVDAPRRMTITATGMNFLAQQGYLPDVPREDIRDKSKADAMAKFLVIIQAAWMLLQVCGRLITRLPVTLLEINTVAHVLCAFSMYTMWWHKPLLPMEPIILRGDWIPDILAFMYSSSEVSGRVNEKEVRSQTMVKTLFASLHLYSKTAEIDSLCFQQSHDGLSTTSSQDPILRRMKCLPATDVCMKHGVAEKMTTEGSTAFFERRPRIQSTPIAAISGDPVTKQRWARLEDVTQRVEASKSKPRGLYHPLEGGVCFHVAPEQLLAEHSRNWPSDELLREVNGLVVGMVLWLANFLYGGIHLAAWNDHFPSSAEKWLWRSSAAYIAFCGGLWVILNFIVSRCHSLNIFWERWMNGEKSWVHNITLGALVLFCGSSLVFARAYVVIEAFVSIRSLPTAAYQTPSWTQIFPHF